MTSPYIKHTQKNPDTFIIRINNKASQAGQTLSSTYKSFKYFYIAARKGWKIHIGVSLADQVVLHHFAFTKDLY